MHEKSAKEVFGHWKVAFIGLAAILVCMIVVSGVFSRRAADERAARKAAPAAHVTDAASPAGVQTSAYCDGDCPARSPWGDPYIIVMRGSTRECSTDPSSTNSAA
jgi:hypothetical protein